MFEGFRQGFFQKAVPLKTFLVRNFFGRRMQLWTTNLFHRMYVAYPERALFETYWMGIRTLKCPFDLWVYQEILYSLKPDIIIETGTYDGGSALYMAHICDLLDHGRVLTVDEREDEKRPFHPRVEYIQGNSTHPETLDQLRQRIGPDATVMVVLDSDHSRAHVLRELALYSPLVTRESYLIVEDTQFNGHPVRPEFGPGPMEAVEEFMQDNTRFEVDRRREKFFMSFNYRGYLRRL